MFRLNVFTGTLDIVGESSNTVFNSLIAGQSFSANTSYAVRWGIESNGENPDRVYAADYNSITTNNYWAIGIALSTTNTVVGENINVYSFGIYTLGSEDVPFLTSDTGNPVWLTSGGTFSTSAPDGMGDVDEKIGIVINTTQIWINNQLMGVGGSTSENQQPNDPYTPSNSANWTNPIPTTIQQALDRIAAVVGANTPIP